MSQLIRRRLISAIAVISGGPLLGTSVRAFAQQSYPNKPIKMIAPYPPGGGVDTVARLVAERLSVRIGQTIAVENRPGAGATIGADALAKSPADGYTLMLGSITDYAIAPHVHKNLGFDMKRDFIPVVEVAFGTVGLVVYADLPAKNLQELIAFAKANPGQLSYASSGVGGSQHLNAEMFKQMAGVDLVHVPYKGTTQFLPDLMSGRVQMSVDSMPAHLPHIKSGKVRALAVATRTRVPMLPDVPTMAEAGLPGYETATNYTLFVPTGTPADIVALLNRETNAVLQQADVKEKLLTLGIITIGGTTESAQARVPAELTKWANVIKNGNIKLN
jgi:tripartite-type tricarboxylate transporter receptor subunit TctC